MRLSTKCWQPCKILSPECLWLPSLQVLARRAQLHLAGDDVIVFSRNGNDVTRRFGQVAAAVAGLRAKSVVIDAELVACDADGNLNFYAMMGGAKHGCCAWCFDLLELNATIFVASRSTAGASACGNSSSLPTIRSCGFPATYTIQSSYSTQPTAWASRASFRSGAINTIGPAKIPDG